MKFGKLGADLVLPPPGNRPDGTKPAWNLCHFGLLK
jgi:hypothetical protein